MMLDAVVTSPIGKLGIAIKNEHLIGVEFLPEGANLVSPSSCLGAETIRQLNAYFQGRLLTFSLPAIFLSTSLFTEQVINYLTTIKCGVTQSYGEIAKTLNTSARAIGNACRRNPIPIIFPCHRVVAQHNDGGYAGATSGALLYKKQWLLNHEKNLGTCMNARSLLNQSEF